MIVLKRRNMLIISVLVITALTIVFCLGALAKTASGNAEAAKIKIVLDAGHGGIDGGVSGVKTGVKESELNLAVVKKLEKYLTDAGMTVVLTRSSSAGLYGVAVGNLKKKDMKKRKEIIEKEKPVLVVSVHMNKFSSSTRRGAQVFYKNGDDEGKLLAESVQKSFNTMKEAPRTSSPLAGDYYILNCTNYPSIIAECGFLSNPEDEALLVTEEYQSSVAYAVFKGIVGYLTEASYAETFTK